MLHDLRFGLRQIFRQPRFAFASIGMLTLGIGATTIVYAVFDAVFLRPLPYPEPDRLVYVSRGAFSLSQDPQTADIVRERSTSFDHIAVVGGAQQRNVTAGDNHIDARVRRVTADYFKVLEIPPIRGRDFSLAEERENSPVVILAAAAAQRLFGDADPIGRFVTIGRTPHLVVGITGSGFNSLDFPEIDAWIPLRLDANESGRNYDVFGRLRQGVALPQAQAEIAGLSPEVAKVSPGFAEQRTGLWVTSLRQRFGADLGPTLAPFGVAVLAVLLISCANVAGVAVARTSTRHRELAVRAALGASRWQLMRQILTEHVLLAVAGSGFGVVTAVWGIHALEFLFPWLAMFAVRVNMRVLLATLAISTLTGIGCGLAPSIASRLVDFRSALLNSGSSNIAGARIRGRRFLVAGQVALTMVLLVSSMLLIRTLIDLRTASPGFDPRHVLTAQMRFEDSAGTTLAFYRQALDAIRQISGVESAAVTSSLPAQRGLNLPVTISGYGTVGSLEWQYVSPEYFRTLSVRLVAGRSIADSDSSGSAGVALVNEAFVRAYVKDGQAIGATAELLRGAPWMVDRPRSIVGIVGDTRGNGLSVARPTLYVPVDQVPEALLVKIHGIFQMNWLLRSRGASAQLIPAVEGALRRVDPSQRISAFSSMDEVVSRSVDPLRTQMFLIMMIGAVALLLAAGGIYALMSMLVARRVREFGVRLALGATAGSVVTKVLADGIALTGAGVVLGAAIAPLLAGVLRVTLQGVRPNDFAAYALSAIVLLAVAAVASAIPIVGLLKVSPTTLLRWE